METVVKQALSAAGVNTESVVVDGDTVILIGVQLPRSAQNMGHCVPHGKSLIEKIRDDLDEAYEGWKTRVKIDSEFHKSTAAVDWDNRQHCQFCFDALGDQYMAEGIAHALGVLRSSSADHEWEEAEQRYEVKNKS